MDWWILELITVGEMVAVLGVLGPLIKRFGKSYAADVFRANPRTGKSYLVLMDFAYYMIFGAYILFSIKWKPDTGWEQQVNAEQLQGSVVRIGGMLMLMGLLHGLNVLTLPVIGQASAILLGNAESVLGRLAARLPATGLRIVAGLGLWAVLMVIILGRDVLQPTDEIGRAHV